MNKILLSLSLLAFSFLSAQTGVSGKLVSILNEQGAGMTSVVISAVPFPEVLKKPAAISLKDGILTYKGTPEAKGNNLEFARCFPLVPVMIVVTEATDSKGVVTKTMTVTTAVEASVPASGHVAACSKNLEGLIPAKLGEGTRFVKLAVGTAFVATKASFKISFADGMMTAEGKNEKGDLKTTVYAPAFISRVDVVTDDKANKDVGIVGGLNLAPIKLPEGKKLF